MFGAEVFLHYSQFFVKGNLVIGGVECIAWIKWIRCPSPTYVNNHLYLLNLIGLQGSQVTEHTVFETTHVNCHFEFECITGRAYTLKREDLNNLLKELRLDLHIRHSYCKLLNSPYFNHTGLSTGRDCLLQQQTAVKNFKHAKWNTMWVILVKIII